MLRRVSNWGVTALGVVFAVCGVVAMVSGWDIIQVERGWSLFIGGAAALAGGAVVIALGQVVFLLDEILVATQLRRTGEKSPAPAAKPQPKDLEPRSRQPSPQAPPAPTPTPAPAQTPPAQQAPLAVASAAPPAPPAMEPEREAEPPAVDEPSGAEPREVDRYESGDITYVMFSDGAVEVRTSNGAQRFASLAELRAQAAQQY